MTKKIEKKFLVMMPDTFVLGRNYAPKIEYIDQTYLLADTGERKLSRVTVEIIGERDYISKFFYTEKHFTDETGDVGEKSKVNISFKEYTKLIEEADPKLQTISKIRYIFHIDHKKYELDIYSFESNYAILKVELESMDSTSEWPAMLSKVKDVTSDKRFSNRIIAETFSFPED